MKTLCRRCLALPLLLLLALPTSAVAQNGAIAGTVRDEASGAPLSAVFVEVLSASGMSVAGSYSGPGGAYRISEIPPGTYSVRFTSPGWRSVTVDGQTITAGQTTSLSVEMSEQQYALNPITVTASKTQEKILDAPAMVEVAPARDIEERPVTNLTEHVREKAGVDVITTGLQSNYMVVRGFNNIFSGATLTLTDNRIARVPSLRTNIAHLNPITNMDLARMEVVLGPGSALYGPNAANGVIHSITKSPIEYPGASLSVAGGLRQQSDSASPCGDPLDGCNEGVVHAEGRVAAAPSDQFGFKLSGQYFKGTEFVFIDEVEAEQQGIAEACVASGYDLTNPACLNFSEGLNILDPVDQEILRQSVDNVAGGRNNNLERWTFDGRLDWRPDPQTSLILAGGRTQAVSSVDLTGIGAGQVVNWAYNYLQSRFLWKNLFAQFFMNWSDNDDTYLLRSGRPLIDKSRLYVGQLQHSSEIGDKHRLIYGADILYTKPDTETTINGQNEDDDDITEIGGYLQWEWAIDPKLDFVGAARVDHHSLLDEEGTSWVNDLVFSPRAAFVFKPDQQNSFRAAFNRAYSTPTTLNYFLDISSGSLPLFGPFRYDVRAQGATKDGLQFVDGPNGLPTHMSPFAPLVAGAGVPGFEGATQRTLLPTSTPVLWAEAMGVVGALAAAGQLPPDIAGLILGLPVPTDADIDVVALVLDPSQVDAQPSASCPTPPFCTVADLTALPDIPALKATITNTIEVGYRGLFADRFLVGVNGWWSRINDYISALRVSTPNVFLNGQQIGQYVASELIQQGVPPAQATAIAEQTAQTLGVIPLGVVTPGGVGGTEATLALAYQNLGSFNLFGGEIAATVVISDEFEVEGTFSLVNRDKFTAESLVGEEEVPLNAPKVKGSATLRYRNSDIGLNGAIRFRAQNGFDANSGVYIGRVDSHEVLDLGLGWQIPRTDFWLQLDIQNLFDKQYQSFVGTPVLGRFILARIRYDFSPL